MIQQKEQDFKYCPIKWYYILPCYIKPSVTTLNHTTINNYT